MKAISLLLSIAFAAGLGRAGGEAVSATVLHEEYRDEGVSGTKELAARPGLAALAFALECVKRGAIVSEPFGDDAPYDLIVHVKAKLFKVNVKTAWPMPGRKGVFTFNGTRKVPRNAAEPGPSCRSVNLPELAWV
jgi:hypothetical protein